MTSFPQQVGVGGGGRVETGTLVSLGPGSGRCKQIPGLWSGKLGVRACGGGHVGRRQRNGDQGAIVSSCTLRAHGE